MKKIIIILVTVTLNVFLFSCTSDDIISEEVLDNLETPQACCGNEGDIPPPPPPPDGN